MASRFVIDANLRTIIVPDPILGVKGEHNVNDIHFSCPRFYKSNDLSTFKAYVNYINANGEEGTYPVVDLKVDEDDQTQLDFSWSISKKVTKLDGTVIFGICMKRFGADGKTVEREFHTGKAKGKIKDGLCFDDSVSSDAEIIENLTNELAELTKSFNTYVEEHSAAAAAVGKQVAENTKNITVLEETIDDTATYEPIEIKSFTSSVSIAELGDIVPGTLLMWSTSRKPTSLTINGVSLDPSLTQYELKGSAIDETVVYTLTVTDEDGNIVTAQTSITFVNGIYYGVAKEPQEYNSDFVLGLSENVLSAEKARMFEVDAVTEQDYIYYCVPTHLGSCVFSVSGFTGGFGLVAEIDVTNTLHYTEKYYIYRSDMAGLGLTPVTVR